ncbi:uncharacterized protein LOC132548087 [Ylistrum balloti]|uniref:uncharacterized protein LOC132548087 n=1 Tax=Ylistrum balloti TaxID=509963 RepID=UPI00290587FB|nr:uncharacterized protein LOC132548087 [Ylistrum balloti]
MEKCDYAGFLDVPEGAPVVVNGGILINTDVPNPCSIVFRATNPEHILTIDLTVLNLIDCTITLNFIYSTEIKTFRCGTKNPGQIYTNTRQVTVNFLRGDNFSSYKFQFLLTSTKPIPVLPGDNANPSEVGLIVGIVAGVFCLLLFIAILAVCCHRRAQKAKILYKANQAKQPLDQQGRQSTSVGFTNNAVQNGYTHEASPRAKTKLLSETEGSSSPSSRPKTLNFHSSTKSEENQSEHSKQPNIDFQDDDDMYDKTEDMKRPPKSPFLSALSSNAKFKASNAYNNRDAEERAKRISSSSSLGSSGVSRDSPPPLPVVPVSKSPTNKRRNHASIRRAYRTASSSEEEFNQIAKASANRDDSGPSSAETAASRDDQRPNTKHSLKPDKSKKKGNKKDMKLEEYEPTSGNFQKNTARASKRAQKSPRLGNRGDGFGHRRRKSEGRSDGEDSRPGTPNSMYDLESLPPLTRSSSRQSLYASRSSLYRRRGRKGSFTESVASTYVHDDMEIGRHSRSYSQAYDDDDETDGYEQPISRRDKERMFRSMGELGRDTKERSTQTLRETATQTGLEQSVIMQPKRVVKKKRRSKSMSAVGTQTTKGVKKTETETESSVEKPKPKPKPKPRKSTNSVSTVAAAEDSDSGKKKKKKKRAKSREDLSHADKAVPREEKQVPAPQVPGQPYLQYNMPPGTMPPQMVPGGYPGAAQGMPVQAYPAGYPNATAPYSVNPQTGYMMQPQAGQPIPGQPIPGQPLPGQPIHHPVQQVPQQGHVPMQPAHIPGKPRKSNWDTLCAMTDGDHQQKQAAMTETGSIASSVFTYNLPSHVGHPGIPVVQGQPQQQPGAVNQAYSNMAFPAAMAAVPQTETMQRVPPSYMDAINMDSMSGPPSSGPYSNGHQSGSLSGSDTAAPVIVHNDTTNLLPKKSSWEVLKEITDNQKNESVV